MTIMAPALGPGHGLWGLCRRLRGGRQAASTDVLIISSATASCGCTVPEWPKEPIPVGEEGEIAVRFNSAKKPGVQNKTITITANTYPKINRLRIKANVAKADNPS